MATQGGVIETKTLGFPIGTNGTFNNTVLVDGKIQLGKDAKGVFYEEGEWISPVVDIQDNFESFGKVFASNVDSGSSSIAVLTRTSDNGLNFDSWVAVGEDGSILSQKRRYISVKIVFYASWGIASVPITSIQLANDNLMVADYGGSFGLKRDHEFDMTQDETWAEEGTIFRHAITRSDWIRIDKMNVLQVDI